MVKNGYAPASTARHLASIKSFLSYIYCEGYISSDISSRLKYKSRRRRLPYTLTIEELNKIMEQIPEKSVLDIRNRAFLEFLYGTGARISEACDILLDQVLLKEKSVILTGKGRKQRLVPLNIMCMETLKKYLKCRPKAKGEDFLFLSRTGKSIGRENGVCARYV
jgi:site-specific recombinase XerD